MALLAAAAAFAPVAVLTWDVPAAAAPYIAASAALELAYFGLLAAAYARADLTFVYPIARGAAPVIVLAVSIALLGAALPAAAIGGVLAVAAGVLLVRGIGVAPARAAPTAGAAPAARAGAPAAAGDLALALGVAACIAGYTLVDDEGVRHAAVLPYFEAVLVLAALPYAAAVAVTRGPAALRAAATPRAAAAGLAMFGAYGLVLAALELAEAAPVAALRETGVVMATVAAALGARERVPPRRLAGAVIVVAGVAAIALA